MYYVIFLTHGWYDVKIPRVMCLQHVMPRETQLFQGLQQVVVIPNLECSGRSWYIQPIKRLFTS